MNRHDQLDEDLLWDESGHLSEIAKCALADGQDEIVPPQILAHYARCEACVRGVGELALVSAEMSAALAPAPVHSLPWIPVLAATVIAAVSAIPLLFGSHGWLAALRWMVDRGVPLASHALVRLLARGVGPTLALASTVMLIAMGLAVARLMPRAVVEEKGVTS